jgi:Stage II sporulation protein E (SpoIIE)
MNRLSPWQDVPRSSVAIFFVAVFFIFGTLGFVNDIIDMGRQPPLRFWMGVVLSGLFAVSYAAAGVTLRSRFWKVFLPMFALQLAIMYLLGNWFPDAPRSAQLSAPETDRLESRLLFDGLATTAAVFLGYAGFVFVFVSESRRHIRVHTEKVILDAEMAAAREVQQVILPAHGEHFPGYTVEAVYQPARQVGGDFFQTLPDGDGGMIVVIGDVAGKGLPAAMMVSMLVGSIRTAAEDTRDPVLLLRKLHDRLIGRTCGGFSTALAAHIGHDGIVNIANAGHLSPYLDGREIELPGALPLGIDSGGQYLASSFELRPGSRLTFYTDGVVEAQNQHGELFGFDRAKAISTRAAAAIVEAAVQFGQSDDITVVTIERRATGDASSSPRGKTSVLASA